jgi:hypothetical protein
MTQSGGASVVATSDAIATPTMVPIARPMPLENVDR